jgi:hypothetical protein
MIVIYCLYAYVILGVCFGVFFVVSGAEKIHHSTKGGGIGLKLLLLPASVIFWPYLLLKIMKHQ